MGNIPNYERYSARVNTETQKGIFKLGESIFLVRSNENPLINLTDAFGGTNVTEIPRAAPTIPVHDPLRKGGFGGADAVIHNSITTNVPGFATLIKNNVAVTRAFADVYAEAKLLNKDNNTLTYKINASYDFTLANDSRFIPQYDLGYFFTNNNARAVNGIRQYTNALIENTLSYDKKAGKHALKVLVGQTYQSIRFYNIGGTTSYLTEPYQPILSNGTGAKGVYEGSTRTDLYSILGRLNYSYDDRYLLTANYRSDASSNISIANRTRVFPSLSVAWKLHNEKFFTMPSFISELKIRAGWGQVGNQGIPPYNFQYLINQNIPYSFSNSTVLGAAATLVVDPNLKWELRTTRNIGIDGTLLDGKLDFTFEYYSNQASDILIPTPIPSSTGSLPNGTGGSASYITNVAGMENSGFEFSFTYRKQIGAFSFEISPNAYTLRNRVTELKHKKDFLPGAGSRTEVGKEIGSHYGWVYEGIFQTADEVTEHAFQSAQTAPGDIKFKDISGPNGVPDGKVNDYDRQYLGNSLPSLYYGLNVTAKFKSFDLTVFASGSSGNLINNAFYRGILNGNSYNNYSTDLLNRWTPTNTNTDIPRMVLLDPNSNVRDSDRPGWLEKGNYVRINTVSLGYNLPSKILRGLTFARFYITCQNLATITKYKGYNPDFTSGTLNPAFDGGSYPKPRTFMAGVQLRF